jgi:hypothetical protein
MARANRKVVCQVTRCQNVRPSLNCLGCRSSLNRWLRKSFRRLRYGFYPWTVSKKSHICGLEGFQLHEYLLFKLDSLFDVIFLHWNVSNLRQARIRNMKRRLTKLALALVLSYWLIGVVFADGIFHHFHLNLTCWAM